MIRGRPAPLARCAALLLLLACAVVLVARPAAAPPVPPMRVDGAAFDAFDSPLPAGTPIRAFLDGVDYSNGSVVLDGAGSFSVQADGNWRLAGASDSPSIKEGADPDETFLFVAGDLTTTADVFEEVLSYEVGAVRTQDLHLADASLLPAPLKIQGLVPRPAQGGSQVAFVCNPTGAPVILDSYYVELNRPGLLRGPRHNLTGTLDPGVQARVEFGSASFLIPTGDAVKLVYENPGGLGAPAAGRDVVVDRVEYNATVGGTLSWEPGNTILGDAPAPRPGLILERATFCGDTNDPSDFRLAREPGLPANGPPSVALVDPAPGVTLRSGQPFTIRWTMSDDLFLETYLLVWVNVSVGGANTTLLAGAEGASSVVWAVPDVETADAVLTIDVEDPFGERASATSDPIRITRTIPFDGPAVLVAAIVVAVILGFLLVAYLFRRRRAPPAQPLAPRPPGPPPSAPFPPAAAPEPSGDRRKTCPRCGTSIHERDWTCFFCGYRFPGAP